MSLREDIKQYLDVFGLVAPHVQEGIRVPGMRGSDNGVLHTSRYILIAMNNGEDIDRKAAFNVLACVDNDKILQRAPGMNEGNAPDDHYGFFSLMIRLNIKSSDVKLLPKHWHPMLIYMRAISRGGIRSLVARLFSPLMALIIMLSNRKQPVFVTEDTSDRLLTWNIIEGLKETSLCMRIAGKVWHARQAQIYGVERPVAEIFRRYYPVGIMHRYIQE